MNWELALQIHNALFSLHRFTIVIQKKPLANWQLTEGARGKEI